jgi:hypothetical protein
MIGPHAVAAGSPAEFPKPVVINAEMVADLVDDGAADLLDDLRLGTAGRADRLTVDGDPVRHYPRVRPCTLTASPGVPLIDVLLILLVVRGRATRPATGTERGLAFSQQFAVNQPSRHWPSAKADRLNN